MNFLNFNKEDWINYLARVRVMNDGILSEEEQREYNNFLIKNTTNEKEQNIYHKIIQESVEKEIFKIAKETNICKDLKMYKAYANDIAIETIEEDEFENKEFD